MRKRSIAILSTLMFTLTVALTGCGGNKPTDNKPAGNSQAPTQSQAQAITLKLAHSYATTHLFNAASEEIAKLVKEKSNGKLEIKVFPAGQLGSEKDLADSVQANTLDMAILGPGEMGKRYKPVLVFDAPFVFRDANHGLKVAEGAIGKELWDGLAKASNIRALKPIYYGTRYLTTSKKEVKTVADVKGLKLRVPTQPMSSAIVKAWGGAPTPMALSEVYMALQQNTVDGQENPIATIMSSKFNEVQKYLMKTGHQLQVTPVTISQKKFDSLPEDLKKVLVDVLNEVGDKTSKQMMADEEKMLKDFAAKEGNKIVEVDRESFKKATEQVIKDNENDFGKGLYEKIQEVK